MVNQHFGSTWSCIEDFKACATLFHHLGFSFLVVAASKEGISQCLVYKSFTCTPEEKMNRSTRQHGVASEGICSFQQEFKSSITHWKMTSMHWEEREIQEMCCILSTYLIVQIVIDWEGGGDHGSRPSLAGLAINPFHVSELHNIPSPFKTRSFLGAFLHLFFFFFGHHSSSPSLLPALSKQPHAWKTDGALIANAMMKSTHFTCVIKTKASISCSRLAFMDSHVSTRTVTGAAHSCSGNPFLSSVHSSMKLNETWSNWNYEMGFQEITASNLSQNVLL